MGIIEKLDLLTEKQWAIIESGAFFEAVARGVTYELYTSVMVQIYHYTKHNSINQAAAVFKTDSTDTKLLRFAYKHALEELGHEKMIEHDLLSIGYDLYAYSATPLPATDALIGYLYYVSLSQGAGPRLGYSYWAEDAYKHIAQILDACRRDLDLTKKSMTFFISHAEIDTKHAKEVKEAILNWCDSPIKEEQILRVAQTSLYLTGEILNAAALALRRSE